MEKKYKQSMELMKDSHKVAYSPDFFAILFFPIEHKLACIAPLFGPVLLLLFKSQYQTYILSKKKEEREVTN